MKKVKAIIEMSADGHYSAYMDDDTMDYLVTGTGETVEEAINTFMGGYEDTKQYYKEENKPFKEVEFEFCYDVPSFLSYYGKKISLAGLERITGVAQGQLSHYANGVRKPSKKTTEKIQAALNRFGKELSTVHFI